LSFITDDFMIKGVIASLLCAVNIKERFDYFHENGGRFVGYAIDSMDENMTDDLLCLNAN